jgi:fumarylacetoacetase
MQAAAESGFGLDHLPLGRVEVAGRRQPALRIGDRVLPLAAAADRLTEVPAELLQAETTAPLLAAGPQVWADLRSSAQELLQSGADAITLTTPLRDSSVLLPFEVADYVDFYSSEHHAMNVGRLFRPDSPALPPNWKHLPIGYHGRSGTVVASGSAIRRPNGQIKPQGAEAPRFGPSERLDVEVEVGFVVGVPSTWGEPVPAAAFREHVFGVVLVNDWSARDLQAWEYQPLGPFLGKSFATSVAAWITPLAALESARTPGPQQDPLLPYLHDPDPWTLALDLELAVNDTVVSRPPFASTYYSPGQQLAHMTSNGASLRTGDLYASGTVSGPERNQVGSLLELTAAGAEPARLDDWRLLGFLEDGDEVRICGRAAGPNGGLVTLAEVAGRVESAPPLP